MIAITYATDNYKVQQAELHDELKACGFDKVINYSPHMLEYDFVLKNMDILNQERGAGCALWKPYFIAKTLLYYNDDVFYMDCGDKVKDFNLKFFVQSTLDRNNFFIVENQHKNGYYTRRDCFTIMGCDEEKYWNHNIMEAGVCAFKNDLNLRYFIYDWLDWCQVAEVVKDVTNKDLFNRCNLPGFISHKYDQSILTNLVIKYNISTVSIIDTMKYIDYNARG